MLKSSRKCGTRNAERGTKSRFAVACLLLTAFCLLTFGCRYDMQDQPRYKVYKRSDFWGERDPRASRDLPEGTVARGLLREDKALYTGKRENAGGAGGGQQQQQSQTTTDARGNTVVTTFPDAIDEFPVPVTKELIDRGQERYTIYCQVCHGPTGNGDGMVVRRGFSPPPTYNDDRLRNAPVGHFFDVITNGWGKMNSYAAQVPVADRWAIVAYIRALQISQNPSGMKPLPMAPPTTGGTTPTTTAPSTHNTTTMTNNTNANTTTGQQQPQGGH